MLQLQDIQPGVMLPSTRQRVATSARWPGGGRRWRSCACCVDAVDARLDSLQ